MPISIPIWITRAIAAMHTNTVITVSRVCWSIAVGAHCRSARSALASPWRGLVGTRRVYSIAVGLAAGVHRRGQAFFLPKDSRFAAVQGLRSRVTQVFGAAFGVIGAFIRLR